MKLSLLALFALLCLRELNAYRTGDYPFYTYGELNIPHFYNTYEVTGFGNGFGVKNGTNYNYNDYNPYGPY